MKAIITILAFLVLGGCTASGVLFTEKNIQTKATPIESKVFIYRINQLAGSGGSTTILDNGRNVGAINVGGYVSYSTQPGPHSLLTETTGIDKLLKVDLVGGETYYFRVDYNPGMWTGTFTINLLPENIALPEIKLTRYQGKS